MNLLCLQIERLDLVNSSSSDALCTVGLWHKGVGGWGAEGKHCPCLKGLQPLWLAVLRCCSAHGMCPMAGSESICPCVWIGSGPVGAGWADMFLLRHASLHFSVCWKIVNKGASGLVFCPLLHLLQPSSWDWSGCEDSEAVPGGEAASGWLPVCLWLLFCAMSGTGATWGHGPTSYTLSAHTWWFLTFLHTCPLILRLFTHKYWPSHGRHCWCRGWQWRLAWRGPHGEICLPGCVLGNMIPTEGDITSVFFLGSENFLIVYR